jgi:hypothetical protein
VLWAYGEDVERRATEAQLASLAAELSAVTESVRRSRDRVAAMVEPFLGTDREDLVSALYESERMLRSAERALDRAARSAG